MLRPWTFSGLVLVPLGLVAPSSAFADECGPVEEVQFWTRQPIMTLIDPDLNNEYPPWERTTRLVMKEYWSPWDIAILVYGGCPARFVAFGGKVYSGQSLNFPFLVDFSPPIPEDSFVDPLRPAMVAQTSTTVDPAVGSDPVEVVIFDKHGVEIASKKLDLVVIDHVPQPQFVVDVEREDGWTLARPPYEFVVGESIKFGLWEALESQHATDDCERNWQPWCLPLPVNLDAWSDLHGLPYDLDLSSSYVLTPRVAGTWKVSGVVYDNDGNEVPVNTTVEVRRCGCGGASTSTSWLLWVLAVLTLLPKRR